MISPNIKHTRNHPPSTPDNQPLIYNILETISPRSIPNIDHVASLQN